MVARFLAGWPWQNIVKMWGFSYFILAIVVMLQLGFMRQKRWIFFPFRFPHTVKDYRLVFPFIWKAFPNIALEIIGVTFVLIAIARFGLWSE